MAKILIDDRVGSRDLADQLQKMGMEVELARLEYADIAFEGKGDNDRAVAVGIELKKLTAKSADLVDSLRSGRLAGHQSHGLVGEAKLYDYAWLLIEGKWRIGSRGEVLVPQKRAFKTEWRPVRGNMPASEMEKRLLTLELCAGLRVRHTASRPDTLRFIITLYRWFTDTAMDQHTTHIVDHEQHGYLQLSDFRQQVKRFPGIGLRLSGAVEKHFGGSLRAAVNAPAEEWAGIVSYDRKGKARHIGLKVGQSIVSYCRGET